jgi:anti-anti-sigma factor
MFGSLRDGHQPSGWDWAVGPEECMAATLGNGTGFPGAPLVCVVAGALDLAAAAEVMEGLGSLLDREPGGIDIDISRLSYIDSVGFSVFVTAHYQCLDAGVRLRFLHPSPLVARLLRANGLDEILHLVEVDALVSA